MVLRPCLIFREFRIQRSAGAVIASTIRSSRRLTSKDQGTPLVSVPSATVDSVLLSPAKVESKKTADPLPNREKPMLCPEDQVVAALN